jgi:Spy/CpxP family protein refolding chaperone
MKYLKSSALILALLAPSLSFARGGGGGGAFKMKKMTEELNLSEAQKTQMKTIHESGRDSMKAQREAVKASKKALSEAVASPTSTKEQLVAAHEKFAQAKLEMMRQQFSKVVEMRAILTPEQLAKFPKVAPMDRDGDRGGRFGPGDDSDNEAAEQK